jgi:beta-phosphoglucomutase-like phosphatase (HAD superfamily)
MLTHAEYPLFEQSEQLFTMNELKALIFDVDGTLADTERDGHRIAFNQAFSDFGLDWHWSVDLYGELLRIGGGKERMRYFIEHYSPIYDQEADLDTLIPEIHVYKNKLYAKLLSDGKIPLRPGVKRIFQQARNEGVLLTIATTTSTENVSALLEQMLDKDAMSWFEVIGAGDIVPAKKPAPDIYTYVLDQLGLDAESCIAFEDTSTGLAASTGAGLQTIVAVSDYTREQQFDDAAIVLNHYGEPDMPFEVIRGDANGATYLDMELIRKIHQRSQK